MVNQLRIILFLKLYNKVTFYTPSKTGGRTDMTRTIWYSLKGSTYDIINVAMYNEKPTTIQTMTVELTTNEVKMTKSVTTNMMVTNKKQDFNPSRIVLKMPIVGQTVNWSFKEIGGDNVDCIASWTTVVYNGEQLKAIKVTKLYEGLSANKIEYYVKNIGLWKIEVSNNGAVQILDKLDSLSYDSTAE